ncbi:MAG: hypothetical protein A3K12_12830 [Candidatus Rokubacteria bacterium RIFCSPLOWO2_12_FULL_71_19]|nr:MAG: hypothetical protein A3K12_12830 [Candidatus Rokubacteria bacterium RIFCSPLOWO2_12_FULL_71_19]
MTSYRSSGPGGRIGTSSKSSRTSRAGPKHPDLRRAVMLAIDRQEIVAKALEGAGVPCAVLDPKRVGDFALPLETVQKLPGCRQP